MCLRIYGLKLIITRNRLRNIFIDTKKKNNEFIKNNNNSSELFLGGGWMATSGNLDNPPLPEHSFNNL